MARLQNNAANGGHRTARVLMLDISRFYGPVARDHTQLMRHLDPREFQVTLLANSNGETAAHVRKLPHVQVLTANYMPDIEGRGWRRRLSMLRSGVAFALGIAASMRMARRLRPDIIHGGMSGRMVLLQHPLHWATGAKLIACIHVDPLWYEGLQGRLFRWSLRRVDKVITVSEWVRGRAIEAGVDPRKVVAILNVANLDRFHPNNSGERIRREYGIPQDAPLVVLIGRVFPWKGQGDLVEAMAKVRAEVPDARALIVGWDEPRRGGGPEYRRRLLERRSELGLDDAVIIDEARPEAPEMMAAADVIAVPSTEDPCPLTVLEAMASGKAVVAYRSGGIPEELGSQNMEWMVAPGDIDGLAERIARLMRDETLRRRVGQRNRERAERHFYEARLAEENARVYRELLGWPHPMRASTSPA